MEELLLDSFQKREGDKESEKIFKERAKNITEKTFDMLWEQYYKWDKEYGNMILPIQHFDTMYNLIKHLFQEGKAANEHAVKLDEKGVFFKEFGSMISQFGKHLKEIDNYYCLDGKESFWNKFNECPYFMLLERIKSKEKSVAYMGVIS